MFLVTGPVSYGSDILRYRVYQLVGTHTTYTLTGNHAFHRLTNRLILKGIPVLGFAILRLFSTRQLILKVEGQLDQL